MLTWKYVSVLSLVALAMVLVATGNWVSAIICTSAGSMISWDMTDDLGDDQ
jgi:hypothetical protein